MTMSEEDQQHEQLEAAIECAAQHEPPVLDDARIYKLLKFTNGKLDKAVELLRQSGSRRGDQPAMNITAADLRQRIEESPILKAHFGEGSTIVHNEAIDPLDALLRIPDGKMDDLSNRDVSEIIRRQDEYIASKGLEGVGFTGDDIREMESMAQFVGHSFRKTVDITHGVMVTQLWKLHKRANELLEILNNEEETQRIHFTDKGAIVRYTGQRYTDQEKLEWQKEYTSIVDQIRRISDTTNSGAAIRMKAEMMVRGDAPPDKKKPKRKLKTVSG